MRSLLLIALGLVASVYGVERLFSYNCYQLTSGKIFVEDLRGKTAIQAFRQNDLADEYTDNIVIGPHTLTNLISDEHHQDNGWTIEGDQIKIFNNNSETDCSLDFTIVFQTDSSMIIRIGGNNAYAFAGTVWPVTVINQDYCTILTTEDLNPEYEIYSGLVGQSNKIFSTNDQAVKGQNVTRVYVFSPLFTYVSLDGKWQTFDIIKCDDVGFPEMHTLVGGEDYYIVASSDANPNILAHADKKFRLLGKKSGRVATDIRNFALSGGVTITVEDNGLSKTFTGTGQFDKFNAMGTNFTIDFTTLLTQQQVIAGNGGGEHFQLHIQPPRK